MEVSLKRVVELLKEKTSFIITGHINPDGDSLGSMLALYYYLLQMGKSVRLLLDDEISSMYNFLPGIGNISKPESPLEVDLLVVVDASDMERIGNIRNFIKAPILNIDHHVSNTRFAEYYYIDDSSAATAQIMMELLELDQAAITMDMAVNLYTGIATDCGFFRYANTTASTMFQAARLIEIGVKPHVISEALETKPADNILALTRVLGTLQFYHDGDIAAITVDVTKEEMDTEGFINYPRNIEGVDIAIMFKIVDSSMIRISLRSRQADVSRLALSFGGGGHKRAAGCSIQGSIEEVKKQVIHAAIEQLKESSQNGEGSN